MSNVKIIRRVKCYVGSTIIASIESTYGAVPTR